MCNESSANLFPLPLVAFEHYMLVDERPDYPMTGILAMDFLGEFHRPALEAALEEVLGQHPLFQALVGHSRRRGMCWVAAPRLPLPLDWNTLDTPLNCPRGEAIDLTAEVGFRIWVRQGEGRAKLTLQLHHACGDAVGATAFCGDLLAAYAARRASGAVCPNPTALEAARLLQRGQFEFEPPEPVSSWKWLRFTAVESLKWFTRRPAPLRPPATSSGAASDACQFPGISAYTFDESRTQALRSAAGRYGATLNDLLLCNMFCTILAWNGRHDAGSPAHWLRITMPTNLRTDGDVRMPVANKMSYAFLTRRSTDCTDVPALLRGIRQETEAIKRWRVGLMFLAGLDFVARLPGALRLITSTNRCLATVVLSNVGDPCWHFGRALPRVSGKITAGDVVLEQFVAAPPLRPKTRASLVVVRYAGRLTLCARCDRHLFTLADTRRFLALYVEQLEHILDQCLSSD